MNGSRIPENKFVTHSICSRNQVPTSGPNCKKLACDSTAACNQLHAGSAIAFWNLTKDEYIPLGCSGHKHNFFLSIYARYAPSCLERPHLTEYAFLVGDAKSPLVLRHLRRDMHIPLGSPAKKPKTFFYREMPSGICGISVGMCLH
jgi:hypothetical protein